MYTSDFSMYSESFYFRVNRMISEQQVKNYCREDIRLIENYELAIADIENMWDTHHRKEIQPDGTKISRQELIDRGEYYKVSANDLIFLTHSDHAKLHGYNISEEQKKKLSESCKGNKSTTGMHWYNNGEKQIYAFECPEGFVLGRLEMSEEQKKKLSEQKLGTKNPNYGMHWYNNGTIQIKTYKCPEGYISGRLKMTEETKKKLSESGKGRISWNTGNINKRHWYNNGIVSKCVEECPEGFIPGKLKKGK